MATVVSNATDLRTAIQAAVFGEEIQLNTTSPTFNTYSSVTTLAKFPCSTPLTRTGGYTINGINKAFTTLTDTRIYQENIDGPYAPSTVKNLTLNYNSGNTAIFRATTGTYTLDSLSITGTHGGWAGNGGVYMSLNASPTPTTSNVNLTLKNSIINLATNSQANGTAAFMQSWNNIGTATIDNTQFYESGYRRGSFHFASMKSDGSPAPINGSYDVLGSTFTGDGTIRSNSNRLESVIAMVITNTFQNGSYLDLAGILSSTSVGNNTFNTINGGPGIRFTQKSSSKATLNTTSLNLSGNIFTGYGLAIVNNDIDPVTMIPIGTSTVVETSGFNTVNIPTIGSQSISRFYAGGSVADTINGSGNPDWISGGGGNDNIDAMGGKDIIIGGVGNDTIATGDGSDTLLYYETTEGADTITDFLPGTDQLAFRNAAFGNLGTGPLNAANFSNGLPTNANEKFNYIGNVLYYDADGNGGGAAVQIATFQNNANITASSIVLF